MTGEFSFGLPRYQLDNDFILSLDGKDFHFITSKRSGQKISGTYVCNDTLTPKQIAFDFDGRKVTAIYSLSGNRLLICIGDNDETPPKSFSGGPNERPALIEYYRVE
jgi:uncharacterized protein (TIGR03067 family)